MSRANPVILAGILLVFIAAFGGLTTLKGGLYLDAHEGDTYHLLDILLRMDMGLLPHQDFVTPLGLLAFLPISAVVEQGIGLGTSILYAQIAVALALWPMVTYAAWSRFPPGIAYAFGVITLGLTLALTFGSANAGVSISMHYNRWAWAIGFTALAIALLPSRARDRRVLDGLILGTLFTALLLIKVTYFVCLLPAVLLVLILQRRTRTTIAACVAGLACIATVTVAFGPGHWTGYLDDLINVTGSDVRPFVGVPFHDIVAGPQHLGGMVLGLLGVILLRRSGREPQAYALLFLLGGFSYIVYQNFGNDPKWLLFLAAMLLPLRPAYGEGLLLGIDYRQAMTLVSTAAFALFLPSLANLTLSPLKHVSMDVARFQPMLPRQPMHQDIFIRQDRASMMTAQVHLDTPGSVWAPYAQVVERPPAPVVGGVSIPHCEILAGTNAWFTEITDDLVAAGIPENSQLFTTDILTAFWLFGPFAPLEKGAPWYYGDLSGIENADYVLVPKCSFVARVQGIMIAELNAADLTLELERDNELYALFSIQR